MNVKTPLKFFKRLNVSKYLLAPILIALLLLAYNQWQQQPETVWEEDHVEIGLRKVGDQLLRKYGDDKTPVPPISQKGDYSFELRLPKAVALVPDDLAGLALSTFDETYFEKALVQVYAGASGDMVYGFNINTQNQEEVPCLGRALPADYYQIQLKVTDLPTAQTELQVAMMGMAGFGLLVMILSGFTGFSKKENQGLIEVAEMRLDVDRSVLLYQEKEVSLTQKEASLAVILMKQPGQLVTREYLTEEVWAKDGVITGRSLDVFISRLRKKIAINPKLQIVNKHGQGYVLEVKAG